MRRRLRYAFFLALACLVAGYLIPENAAVPVQGATTRDWNPKSFWFEPWGASGVHKGIDIFAPRGRPVVAAVPGIVLYDGQLGIGGNVVAVLGPKWRIHYYAHLDEGKRSARLFVARGTPIGAVGTSGNAAGKPPHLHYAVISLIPLPWLHSSAPQGWKKMFFIDPASQFDYQATSSRAE